MSCTNFPNIYFMYILTSKYIFKTLIKYIRVCLLRILMNLKILKIVRLVRWIVWLIWILRSRSLFLQWQQYQMTCPLITHSGGFNKSTEKRCTQLTFPFLQKKKQLNIRDKRVKKNSSFFQNEILCTGVSFDLLFFFLHFHKCIQCLCFITNNIFTKL